MVRWSESSIPQSRLVWVNCWGIPLRCWMQAFFDELGWLVGELILIENETLLRNRLDKGRIMILVPQSTDVSCKVKVYGDRGSFVVKVEEDRNPVDVKWLESVLGLRKSQDLGYRVAVLEVEGLHICAPRRVNEFLVSNQAQVVEENGTQMKTGKQKWVSKKIKKPMTLLFQNDKLSLEKRIGWYKRAGSSIEESSSSSKEVVDSRSFLDSKRMVGECSRTIKRCQMSELGKEVTGSGLERMDKALANGQRISGVNRPKKKVSFKQPLVEICGDKAQCEKELETIGGKVQGGDKERLALCVDLGNVVVHSIAKQKTNKEPLEEVLEAMSRRDEEDIVRFDDLYETKLCSFDCGVISAKVGDIQMHGMPLTWSNNREQEKGLTNEALAGWKECIKDGSEGVSLASKIKKSKRRIKSTHPEAVTDFRPISFVGSMYKILAKLLANRLKKVINVVICENQMVIVQSRQIMDSFMVTKEIIHSWRNDKEGGCLVKLDFEKAHDSMDHSFLDVVLEAMGFGIRWR
ncbi:hypothetical protein Ddye_011890 [Dipteronia dyeriana]|uniref:Reverse transcriptase domain-containing protein n=1 Tax=Dipteronia dyeriana TaxID=168575 RepID=A0AAD9X3F6_9ROSI|nr:hypothetical protein Ddye_011890 [Dipteronia dyeriana]